MEKNLVRAGLVFGIASYCLVLLVSQEAPIVTLILMGAVAMILIASSMWLLWSDGADEVQNMPQEPENAPQTESREPVIR